MDYQGIPEHHFVRDDERSIPFRFEALKHKTAYDNTVPHRHNYYEIFLFEKGGGEHMVDFRELPIKSRSIHFVSPGQVHEVKRKPGSFGSVIMFSREFVYANREDKEFLFGLHFFNNKLPEPFLNLTAAQFKRISALVEMVREEYREKLDESGDIIRNYLNILLLKCNSLFESVVDLGPNVGNSLLTQFKTEVEKNYKVLQQVQDYAEILNVSPSHLNEAIKKSTGGTASSLIHDRIVLEAKRMLHHSSLSTKEIAYFLNFKDPAYFSRYFKRHAGESPANFRILIRDKYK